ncbi:hypothetical protein BJ546DRAFT_1056777 [Cryomyces antarcticus]
MHSYSFLTPFLVFASLVGADGLSDVRALAATVKATTDTIHASLNGTMFLNTADLLANVSSSITSSKANLDADQVAFMGNNTTQGMDTAYLDYINALLSLAQYAELRGKSWHTEWNQAVYTNLQALATAVHAYGTSLTQKDVVTRNATICTITAGGALVQAESARSRNLNYPGKQRRAWVVREERGRP